MTLVLTDFETISFLEAFTDMKVAEGSILLEIFTCSLISEHHQWKTKHKKYTSFQFDHRTSDMS